MSVLDKESISKVLANKCLRKSLASHCSKRFVEIITKKLCFAVVVFLGKIVQCLRELLHIQVSVVTVIKPSSPVSEKSKVASVVGSHDGQP